MATITVNPVGLDAALAQIDGAAAKIEAAVHQGLTAVALMAQADALRSIQRGARTGIVYKLYNPKRTHQASAPGEPPKTDLGGLAMSILVNVSLDDRKVINLVADAPYAVHLEYGTARMAARPFLTPAGDRAAAKGTAIVQKYVDAALRVK